MIKSNHERPRPIQARKKGSGEDFRSAVLVGGYFQDGRDAVRFRNTVAFLDANEYEIKEEP